MKIVLFIKNVQYEIDIMPINDSPCICFHMMGPAKLFSKILRFTSAIQKTKIKIQEKAARLHKTVKRDGPMMRENGNSFLNQTERLLHHASELKNIKKNRRGSVDAWLDESDAEK